VLSRLHISAASAAAEFGMACQRLPLRTGDEEEPPFGAMACFLAAGGSSQPDCHPEEEAMIVLSGTGEVEVAGDREALSPNDVVVLPAEQRHTVHNSSEETLVWISIYWRPDRPANGSST
jgi:mannose-6-phosphate isomerase-like protein (cupin superfamily)